MSPTQPTHCASSIAPSQLSSKPLVHTSAAPGLTPALLSSQSISIPAIQASVLPP